ncbi:PREDICTED: myosin-11-like isoform X2 [Ipomoea nil]|uniref:myosin-11-like isoform X2 n=1 Tax=Ipomoea nil TaxID=35883 RepID=UPI0009009B3D|nr:PREDICTED: myosin-11-like isoform X2 [Ipomoea nil]
MGLMETYNLEERLVGLIAAQNLGFSKGRPIAACIIYKCLMQWRSFEVEGSSICDRIIETIGQAIETQDNNEILAYWLSNASTLLLLLQGLNLDGEAKYPALLFKQKLTAYVEKIYGMIRNNLKKQIFPSLGLCIQVPPFLVRKVFTQVFFFINVQFFNSLLIRRECCAFSHGEYVMAGLAELEFWCNKATDEYAGSALEELKHIRQAIGFLLIHEKPMKTLDEISHDLCPVLSIQQLYRISSMYHDDEYGTHSLSPEVISDMIVLMTEDSNNHVSRSFLLDDDSSIPFSVDDLSKSLEPMDISDIEPPPLICENAGFSFLLPRAD